ncbi:sulfurtransferase [Phycisphaera mikurensis]|uniref:Putative thiosulfate sulfurtransferase n=1 Tax=Phycisphaera mikurensis (strain NBRC 102666 / KCTC 22515 / FYK2301M01) TaxID=1142394 RepID=I0IE07_PHYMF|nr:rhodanese-like domain-containing protein [Phycisphaera mikurensis]MBB6441302.1 thiosulfate/3-mercaptopyruvate sulfurtransferase [Phycisphaera mikurensis]BAM03495.1 putative thiosulfate sulfurtransferase [Phycisphaera mikurensis NBRC 102666]
MIRPLFLVLALLPALGIARAEATPAAPPGLRAAEASGGAFASIAEVAERLAADDPALVLLHVGHGRRGYERGHVPGAFFVEHDEAMVDRPGRTNGLVGSEAAAELFGRLGLRPGDDVVLVGDAGGVFPAPLRLALRRAGVRARLLDGHTRGWVAAGHPLSTDPPPVRTPTSWPVGVVRPVEATREEAAEAAALGRLVDSRSGRLFRGERSGHGTQRGGHIPGARNLPWQDFLLSVSDPRLKPGPDRERMAREAGLDPAAGGPLIVYDAIGTHAALAQAVLESLGFSPVRVLTGGYAGWAEAGLPVHGPSD